MIFRRTLWLLTTGALGLLVGSLTPILAQTAEELIQSKHVMIRHRLDPAEPVYVGQPVRVWVDVMTRTWFLEAPQFSPTIEVRNAIVIPPDAFGVNSTERIGGDTYAVQGRAYTVFPQTAGQFEVPPVVVRLVVALEDASRSPEIILRTDLIKIEARLPAGAEDHGRVLATPSLSVQENYDRALDGLKVGESFRRQVTMTIQDSVAMLLPTISFRVAEGVAVYPARPEIDDQRNRGQLTGTRIDEATYVMESEGTYQLPETTIWWWSLRTSSLEQEVLPAVEFTVEANPELAAEHLGQPEEEETLSSAPAATEQPGWSWKEWLFMLGLLAVGTLVLGKLRRRKSIKKERQAQKGEAEGLLFRRFEDAARSNDPALAYQALLSWLDRFEPMESPASGRQLVEMADDEHLAREYGALENRLFGGRDQRREAAWSGRSLAAAVEQARGLLLKRQRGHHRSPALPALNP